MCTERTYVQKTILSERKRIMAKVKCMICGSVFEEGTEACPVCGVGPENFMEVTTEKTSFRNDTDERFVIIGGGPAAKNAAEAIRDRNKTAAITIITQEPYFPYNRPILTKWIVKDFDREGLAVEGPEWYEIGRASCRERV